MSALVLHAIKEARRAASAALSLEEKLAGQKQSGVWVGPAEMTRDKQLGEIVCAWQNA